MRVNPFGLKKDSAYWNGEAISLDGTATDLPSIEDEAGAKVLYEFQTGNRWDGDCAGVVRLADGRLMAWEAWWGPTGDSFCEDAYGGDGRVFFASDLRLLVNAALSDESRRRAGVPEELWNQ